MFAKRFPFWRERGTSHWLGESRFYYVTLEGGHRDDG